MYECNKCLHQFSNTPSSMACCEVCDAIAHYTANFGHIRVADFSGDENTEICLYYGQFAFSKYGDIEVGA